MGPLSLAVALCGLQLAFANASLPPYNQQVSGTDQQQQPQQQQQPPSAAPGGGTSGATDDLYSIDRIRTQLNELPVLRTSSPPDSRLPRYRVEVVGKQFGLRNWQALVATPPSPVPMPFGGTNYFDMTRLNTRPEILTNREGLGVLTTAAETYLVTYLVRKFVESHRKSAVAKVRAEVQAELAEVLAHNARIEAARANTADVRKK